MFIIPKKREFIGNIKQNVNLYLKINATQNYSALKLKLYTVSNRLIRVIDLPGEMAGERIRKVDIGSLKNLSNGIYHYIVIIKASSNGESVKQFGELVILQ